jgi:hypothetical protein
MAARRTTRLNELVHQSKQSVKTLWYPWQRGLRLSFGRDRRGMKDAVMVFDASTGHGGWVDRLKGIVSVYELSQLAGRELKLCMDDSFPVLEFLQPSSFDWRTTREELRWSPLAAGFHVSRDRHSSGFLKLSQSSRSQLFVDTNLDYLPLLHRELTGDQLHTLWGKRYKELFTPKADFEEAVAAYARPGSIAVHTRFTSLLGDFKDVTDRELNEPDKRQLLQDCLGHVRHLAAAHESKRLMVFSDSPAFLDAVSTVAPNIALIPGTPSHLDHSSQPRDSLQKTLLDFYVMLRCEQIVMLRVGPMYNSNFSRYASYVGGRPFAEIGG